MKNDLTKEIIIQSWNNGWAEEFHKQWGKKSIKETFNVVFLESAKTFSKRTNNILNNPFTKFLKTYYDGTVKFKNQIIKILGLKAGNSINEDILLALGETKEKINQIIGDNNNNNTKEALNNIPPTKEELINSWNNEGWAEECLNIIKQGNSFHKAFLLSAKNVKGKANKKLNHFSQKYDITYSLYSFANAIIKILTPNNKSTKIELIIKELSGDTYEEKIILFRGVLAKHRGKINEKINKYM